MASELKGSAQHVQEYLLQRGHEFVVRELPDSTRTAVDAAQAIGCTVGQIGKSLIFKDKETGAPVLVVASGPNMVCTEKIEQAAGLRLGKADAAFVKNRTGFAIGGVPPVAHKEAIRTFLDQDLRAFSSIWVAAGTPNAVFELKPDDLHLLTGGEWMDLAQT